MPSLPRIVLILGAGPNVGIKTAQKFTSAGYRVAVASRTGATVPSSTAALSIAADFANPSSIHGIFEEVRSKLGQPSVVVYNGTAHSLSIISFYYQGPKCLKAEYFEVYILTSKNSRGGRLPLPR
jgi:NAD(P)-dependent dehydrogenase (short-subunit alcohol dehydrogenase family)